MGVDSLVRLAHGSNMLDLYVSMYERGAISEMSAPAVAHCDAHDRDQRQRDGGGGL